VEPVQYVFSIDAFTPATLPMWRLAQYLAELATLLGSKERTHFDRVDPGSAELVHYVEAVEAPKVAARLNGIRIGEGPKDAIAAQRAIDDLLANDNAVGTLIEKATGQIVIPFPGRNRPKPVAFPPFRQDTSIDGVVVRIGGKDASAHVTLQDGDILHTGITMSRTDARALAPLLYGTTVRLHGNGRFERLAGGVWKMSEFKVAQWEKLDTRPLAAVLQGLRAIGGNGMMDPDVYTSIADEREAGDQGQ